jgi:5-methylcytosine-specific restriction enzyme B
MTDRFTWIDIYQELATTLLGWQDRQAELIAFLEDLRGEDYVIPSLQDKNSDGERFPISELDPFTFMGVFNRGIREEQRIAILGKIKKYFKLQCSIPSDFSGIPVLNNMKSWFFPYKEMRAIGHVSRLWSVFQLALQENPLKSDQFLKAFDDVLSMRGVNINLTMGLFWIRPATFLSLDSVMRTFLKIKMPNSGLTAQFYLDTLRKASAKGKSFPELSLEAWESIQKPGEPPLHEDINYWLVGAYWDSNEPSDQTQRFLDEGIWENGYQDRLLDEVKSMSVGDKIGIKASATQRLGLPFDGRKKTVSCNIIKAIGTIIANRDDGRTVEVEWDPDFKEKRWYFYTNRVTVWHVRPEGKKVWEEAADQLIKFVWYGQTQDYDWFINKWWDEPGDDAEPPKVIPYSIEDIVASGVFLKVEEISRIIERLDEKKAVIIQGAPGVGKTFIARKLAYALMKEIDPERLGVVQFHQSYSYDDFVRGYRPIPGQVGSFGIQNGIFYEFCQKAVDDPDREYVFIIDEINRGNLSQIFGEMLMLVEGDKRGPEYAVPLVYRLKGEPLFYIPPNLYLVGLMNIADRSLAMVDYALRRRFAFITLKPQYESDLFRQWLLGRAMDAKLVDLIVEHMSMLNKIIREDPLLGENYQIGHSYFCPKGDDFTNLDRDWYQDIVQTEIVPLLKEYWFDNLKKAEEAERGLLA